MASGWQGWGHQPYFRSQDPRWEAAVDRVQMPKGVHAISGVPTLVEAAGLVSIAGGALTGSQGEALDVLQYIGTSSFPPLTTQRGRLSLEMASPSPSKNLLQNFLGHTLPFCSLPANRKKVIPLENPPLPLYAAKCSWDHACHHVGSVLTPSLRAHPPAPVRCLRALSCLSPQPSEMRLSLRFTRITLGSSVTCWWHHPQLSCPLPAALLEALEQQPLPSSPILSPPPWGDHVVAFSSECVLLWGV